MSAQSDGLGDEDGVVSWGATSRAYMDCAEGAQAPATSDMQARAAAAGRRGVQGGAARPSVRYLRGHPEQVRARAVTHSLTH